MQYIRMRLSEKELEVLEERLAIVKLVDYDLHTYDVLRNLYGRVISLRQHLMRRIYPGA